MIDLRTVFGFHETPFTREIAPEKHLSLSFMETALAGLARCVEAHMSGALIAPSGGGKTTLVRRLRAHLPEARFQSHYVKVTDLSKRDLCRAIALACGVPTAGSHPALFHHLQERFEKTLEVESRWPVLIIDEAQDLRVDSLALVRLITNFEMDSRLVLSVVLCGQPALKTLLARDDQESVARRIYHYATLRPLTREELSEYVAHRCAIAGARTCPFDASALEAIHEIARGNLRTIDLLALKGLELAALSKKGAVGAQLIALARKDLWP